MSKLKQNIKEMDCRIAGRVYQARKSSGFARRELSKSIGVSVQQLSKYEKGENRIPVSRLLLLARTLGEDISYFYKDLKGRVSK
jgi:transcriptional regulator with XRE-family HTH domain